MREQEWAVQIDRHDDHGRKLDSVVLRVRATSRKVAQQRATQELMDRYDCDWSLSQVRAS